MYKSTKTKYTEFLEYLSKKGIFSLSKEIKEYKLTATIGVVLKEENIVHKIAGRGNYAWGKYTVDEDLVQLIAKNIDARTEEYLKSVQTKGFKGVKKSSENVPATNVNISIEEQKALAVLRNTGNYIVYRTTKLKLF